MTTKTEDEKKHLIKNIKDLSESVSKELDFKNESIAATELKKYTKMAKVVEPIEVKNGIYIMERAEGISLASLVELNSAKNYRDLLQKFDHSPKIFTPKEDSKLGKLLVNAKDNNEKIQILNKYIEKVEARTPQFGDISLSDEDFKFLLEEYQQVIVEQFYKIDKNGKVLHADIHPGNIFVDINALRNARKQAKYNPVSSVQSFIGKRKNNKIFTLIDTGNTLKQTQEQALRSMKLTSYIENGNVPDIADYVLEGAVLPNGMTNQQAKDILTQELKKMFFDYETKLDPITNNNILDLTSSIMRKNNIVPADTQLTYNKAVQSSNNSIAELRKQMIFMKIKDVKSMNDILNFIASVGKDVIILKKQYTNMIKNQEKLNQVFMSPEMRLKQKRNPNMLKTNSEEHLTYQLKQRINTSFDFE